MPYPVLALDFDGVICDSIHECLPISYAAYEIFHDRMPLNLKALEALSIPEKEKALFYQYRGFVRPARHYFLLWNWIHKGCPQISTQKEFDALEQGLERKCKDYGELFFKVRNFYRSKDASQWVALNPLFSPVEKVWNELKLCPYIVTTKDQKSVELILNSHKLPYKDIYANERIENKATALKEIAEIENVAPQKIFYVDDHPNHLLDAKASGATLAWASWGYSPVGIEDSLTLTSFDEIKKYL